MIQVYRVEGITCLDCAARFERAVASLPGVSRAVLNPMAGRLVVEGEHRLSDIQSAARTEGYVITPAQDGPAVATRDGKPARVNWPLARIAVSSVALAGSIGALLTGIGEPYARILYAVAIVAGAWGNVRRAVLSLSRLRFNTSVLMTSAVIGAVAIGEWTEAALVALLFGVSEALESWTMQRARRSLQQLVDLTPKTARVLTEEGETERPVERVEIGDILTIRPGERIALDGVVLKGSASVDEAPITGESMPVPKSAGEPVYAGTFCLDGHLTVRVTKPAAGTTIARIIQLVEEAQSRRAQAQAFVDRFAAYYTPAVMAAAALVAIIPPVIWGGPWGTWVYRGLALLVVACPCALVVSTPVSIVSAISAAARHGVLIKGGIHLEQLGRLTAVAFDKTGTLTAGKPVITDVVPVGSARAEDVLAAAAALESHASHPLAAAVVEAARARGIRPSPVDDFRNIPGLGVQGTVGGQTRLTGSPRLLAQRGLWTPETARLAAELEEQGKTVIAVAAGSRPLGLLAAEDRMRDEAPAAVAALRQAGIRRIIVLTGDNERAARRVAALTGADDVRAGLLPEDKVAAVRELLAGNRVAMVGDGINDAPALAAATVGIAMGGAGTDTALETADVVLMSDDLGKLPFLVRLSKATVGTIRQNIAISLAIKAAAVLLAFSGWLTLWLAITADMGASLLVTVNGMRLLRFRPSLTKSTGALAAGPSRPGLPESGQTA
ncbi:MAG: cadmium-translocating P-type ATPase [Firmicutes bacterium]|nr:cadmium-translocating P-type ATPase [Bacillota bacterium]